MNFDKLTTFADKYNRTTMAKESKLSIWIYMFIQVLFGIIIFHFELYILFSLMVLSTVLTIVLWTLVRKKDYWSVYSEVVVCFACGYEFGLCILAVLVRQEGLSEMLIWGYGILVLLLTLVSCIWVRYRINHPKTYIKKRIDPTVGILCVIAVSFLTRVVFKSIPEITNYILLLLCIAVPVCVIPHTVALAVKLYVLERLEKM